MIIDPRRFAFAFVALLLPLLFVAACAPERDEVAMDEEPLWEPEAAPEPDLGMPPPDAAPGDEVHVTLLDGEIQMPTTLAAGAVTLHVMNSGTRAHGIEIEGEGVDAELEPRLGPGETGTLTVDLRPGTYRVYCPVDDHAELGMELQLEVTEAGGF